MNEITLNYDFNGHSIRVSGTYEEPWFVAADVCSILGIQNVSEALNGHAGRDDGLDASDVADIDTVYVSPSGVTQTRKMSTVSESGLYELIFKSRKPEARKFQRWVTHEVLPEIRKTGAYIHDFELFMTHPIMKDLEARALETVTKTMDQVHRLHLVPHIMKKFRSENPKVIEAVLREVRWFNSLYIGDGAGGLQYMPKSKRKAAPSAFTDWGRPDQEIDEQYRMLNKHITRPLETLAQFKARNCERPKQGVTPLPTVERLKATIAKCRADWESAERELAALAP